MIPDFKILHFHLTWIFYDNFNHICNIINFIRYNMMKQYWNPNYSLLLLLNNLNYIFIVHYMMNTHTLRWIFSACTLQKQNNLYRPRGKESTEVRITQNKGKESENSYQKLERHTETKWKYFDGRTSFSFRRERMYVSTQQRWRH